MLFLPSNLEPNSSVFDATKSKVFTWLSQGDPQTDFQLKIYRNLDSVLIYDSTKITSNLQSFTVPQNSLLNNVEYKWNIRVWSGSNFIDSQFVFIKTLLSPVITMTVPSTINSQTAIFTASYNQAQGVPYDKWRIYVYDSQNLIIGDSQWQYGYNISYTFDAFETDKSYSVECITESLLGLLGTTGKIPFNVSYSFITDVNYFNAEVLNCDGGIKLVWTGLIQIIGNRIGDTSFVEGKFLQALRLGNNGSVLFDVDVPIQFTQTFYVKLIPNFNGDIIVFGDDELSFGYSQSEGKFYIKYLSLYIYGKNKIQPSGWFLIGITENNLYIFNREDIVTITTLRNGISVNPLETINPLSLNIFPNNTIVKYVNNYPNPTVDNLNEWIAIGNDTYVHWQKTVDILSY